MTAVIGIDPSMTATGIAHCDGTTETVTYPKGCTGDARLEVLLHSVEEAVLKTEVHFRLAIIEDLPTHAHGAGITGMAQGVVRLALTMNYCPYTIVTPATLKKFATGKGNATKADMRMSLYQRAGLDLRDDNQVDAWWLRELGLHLADQPSISLPKTHLAALDKVAS